MKCLLEYLLSITVEFKSNLDLLLNLNESSNSLITDSDIKINSNKNDDDDSLEQILFEPEQATHYILAIWLNLSSRKECPIYGFDNTDLKDLICEYLEFAINSLEIYSSLISNNKSNWSYNRNNKSLIKDELLMYLHLKILRNMSQYIKFNKDNNKDNNSIVLNTTSLKWLKQLNESTNRLMIKEQNNNNNKMIIPMTVECLASLGNLILNIDCKIISDNEEKDLSQILSELSLQNLIENLFLKNIDDYNTENDDLLLVSIIFLGILAKKMEICKSKTNINQSIIKATNYIIESRLTDNEMIINTLYTLIQLTNHSEFLRDISNDLINSIEINNNFNYLIEKLTYLMANGNNQIIKLSVLLLIRFCQLEEQRSIDESIIMRKRFVLYNNKWLNAINVSRDNISPAGRDELTSNTYDDSLSNDDYDDHETYDTNQLNKRGFLFAKDEFNQLHTLDELKQQQIIQVKESNNNKSKLINDLNGDDNDEDDLISDDDDDYDEDNSFINEPDLNVIDANSMTKHLTSRRKFRSELLRK